MINYSIEQRTRKYVKEYSFMFFARNSFGKKKKKILHTATKLN